jgi:hypothetical protein
VPFQFFYVNQFLPFKFEEIDNNGQNAEVTRDEKISTVNIDILYLYLISNARFFGCILLHPPREQTFLHSDIGF